MMKVVKICKTTRVKSSSRGMFALCDRFPEAEDNGGAVAAELNQFDFSLEESLESMRLLRRAVEAQNRSGRKPG